MRCEPAREEVTVKENNSGRFGKSRENGNDEEVQKNVRERAVRGKCTART